MSHELRRLRPVEKTDLYVAECSEDDFEGEAGSPANVGRDFYRHQDEMKADEDEEVNRVSTR